MKKKGLRFVIWSFLGLSIFVGLIWMQRVSQVKQASQILMAQTRARLNAWSGLEKAYSVLWHTAGQFSETLPFDQQHEYGGEDRNRDNEVSSLEEALGNANGRGEIFNAQLEQTVCPSLALRETKMARARLIKVGKHERGVSWNPDPQNFCSLKIVSSNGLIDLNSPGDSSQNLLNALGNYFRWRYLEDQFPTQTYLWSDEKPLPLGNTFEFKPTLNSSTQLGHWSFGLGNQILAGRPADGYKKIEDVRSIFEVWVAQQRQFSEAGTTELDEAELWRTFKEVVTVNARPQQLIDVHAAAEPVLVAMIHSVSHVKQHQVPVVNHQAGDLLENSRTMHEYGKQNQPLFSMTESVQMARQWIERRRQKSFASFEELHDFLIKNHQGLDYRIPRKDMAPSDKSGRQWQWGDQSQDNRRQKILSAILTPHSSANMFNKSYGYERGAELILIAEGRFIVESRGCHLDTEGWPLAQSWLKVVVDLWEPHGAMNQSTIKKKKHVVRWIQD